MVSKSIVILIIIFLVVLYCCLVQAKKEDAMIEKLYQKSWGNGSGKDEK